MLKYITLLIVVYFFYWLLKQKIRERKMEIKGEVVSKQPIRPITLMSFIMVAVYGGYMLYYLLTSQAS
ncbi:MULTISPECIES: hypothetical protein [Thiomicrorhabdus]|uniref:Uncharacterized protein n=1 Tax=Thiomicrorhabdus heinhorstiae TaxID=2748010 RepID=A0ABS0BYK4_9GAMM|nr:MULTISPECIES: hypothetical protein [Thiomicrorhabdus]MBF6057046.1 hypothetical protein [Thiomicrorhabdus heinhorstiae]